MSDYPEIMENFRAYKLTIQNRSVKTVDQYLLDLELFFKYVIAQKDNIALSGEDFDNITLERVDLEFCRSVKPSDIYGFFNYTVKYRDNKAKARARKLSSIKSFFKYLYVRKYITENPAAEIESPSIGQKTLPKYLTIDESLKLLGAIEEDKESKTRARDYAIVTLFLNCGMRLSELVGISLGDIDPELRSLRVIGKGSKERVVYLNDSCREALSAYIKVRKADGQIKREDIDALFLSSRHQRISNKTVQFVVYKYLERAGLGYKHFSTHKLRHTAATLMYQSGKVDVRVLKDILGHEQLNTTQIYTHVSNQSMEDAVNNNPLNKKK